VPDCERKQRRDNDVHRVHDDPERRRERYDCHETDLDHQPGDQKADHPSNTWLVWRDLWGHDRERRLVEAQRPSGD
jgi:hypothetical protein